MKSSDSIEGANFFASTADFAGWVALGERIPNDNNDLMYANSLLPKL